MFFMTSDLFGFKVLTKNVILLKWDLLIILKKKMFILKTYMKRIYLINIYTNKL